MSQNAKPWGIPLGSFLDLWGPQICHCLSEIRTCHKLEMSPIEPSNWILFHSSIVVKEGSHVYAIRGSLVWPGLGTVEEAILLAVHWCQYHEHQFCLISFPITLWWGKLCKMESTKHASNHHWHRSFSDSWAWLQMRFNITSEVCRNSLKQITHNKKVNNLGKKKMH